MCFVEVQRKINNDWTVCYKGKTYQIAPMSKRAPAVNKCTVKETLSGHISIAYRDRSFPDVAPSVYYGLFALQHRGQESCGIAVTDTYGEMAYESMCERE